MVRKASLIAAIICLAAATGAKAKDQPLEMAGPYPNDYKSLIDSYLKTQLSDPFSAVVEVTRKPRLTAFHPNQTLLGKGAGYANWVVCLSINAKNRFGAYVGFQPYMIFIRNGKIFKRASDEGNWGNLESIILDPYAQDECAIPADTPGSGAASPQ